MMRKGSLEMEKIRRLSKELTSEEGIAVLKNRVERCFPLHWHEFYELEYILSGSGTYTLNGTSYSAKPGMLFFSTYMDFHDIVPQEPIQTLTVEFDERWIDKTLFLDLYTSTVIENFDADWLMKLAEVLQAKQKYYALYAEKLLNCILVEVCRQINSNSAQGKPVGIAENVKMALQYIHLHFRENISMTEIARQSGACPTYFSKIFKDQTGVTLKCHLTDLRIEYAKRLLQYSDIPVTEVCFDSGFNTFSSFYRMFFDRTGMSPQKYKNSLSTDGNY